MAIDRADKNVVKQIFYDLTGKEVLQPNKELYIKTTIFSDGSRVSEKVIK